VVLQILADLRCINNNRDLQRAKLIGLANSTQLQQARRDNGTRAKNDAPERTYPDGCVANLRLHADGRLVVPEYSLDGTANDFDLVRTGVKQTLTGPAYARVCKSAIRFGVCFAGMTRQKSLSGGT
jgi:hypothetical protein